MSKQRKYLHLQESLIYWRITDLRLLFVSKFMISFKNQINKLTRFCFSKLIILLHFFIFQNILYSFLVSLLVWREMKCPLKGRERKATENSCLRRRSYPPEEVQSLPAPPHASSWPPFGQTV